MRRYQPALLGGLFIGVLSALPVVGLLNICCCLWVVAGGVLTAYLLQQNRPDPIEAGDAALSGLLAGLLGAVLYIVAQAVIVGVAGDAMESGLREALGSNPQIPPEIRDRIETLTQGPNLMLLTAAVTLPMYAVASMLGALLGLAMFRKKTSPPAQP